MKHSKVFIPVDLQRFGPEPTPPIEPVPPKDPPKVGIDAIPQAELDAYLASKRSEWHKEHHGSIKGRFLGELDVEKEEELREAVKFYKENKKKPTDPKQ